MDEAIFEKIRTGDGRQKRAWAEALYNNFRGILTGKGYRNTVFEETFVHLNPDEQVNYINRAIEVIRTAFGNEGVYEPHAEGLAKLIENYHPLHHTKIHPEIQARRFSGTIDKWEEFIDKDGIYRDWEFQSASGKTDLSWEDFASRNYRTIDTAFLRSDSNPEDMITGFDLPQGMAKLPAGTPVEIVALGFVRSDGSFGSNDLYGVRLVNGSAEKAGAPNGVYFDLVRDHPGVLRFMVESQKELGKARQLLYQK